MTFYILILFSSYMSLMSGYGSIVAIFITVELHVSWVVKYISRKLYIAKITHENSIFKKFNVATFHTNIHCCFFDTHLVKWMASLWGHAILKNRDTISSFPFLFFPFYFSPFLPPMFMDTYMWGIIIIQCLDTEKTVMSQRDNSWPHKAYSLGGRDKNPGL